MGNLRVLAGQRYNVLETGTVTVSSEDPLFPASRLYDGRPIQPFRFTSNSSAAITVDGNRIVNGNLNTWSGGFPTGWDVPAGAGVVAETTTAGEFRSGSAARVNGGFQLQQDFTARAGERLVLNGWRRILGAGQGVARAYLLNLQTGNYWTGSGQTWTDAITTFVNDSTNTSYTQYSGSPTVEDFSTVLKDTCTLRLILSNADATATDYVFYDDWFLWPQITFASIHGHNIAAATTVELHSSTDNFSASDVTEGEFLFKEQPAFWNNFTVITNRYLRLAFSGFVQDELIYIGEAVIGYDTTPSQRIDRGARLIEVTDDLASVGETGQRYAVQRSTHNRRVLELSFHFSTASAKTYYENVRNELFRRAGGRIHPVVIVPDETFPEVIHGHIDSELGVVTELTDYMTGTEIRIAESPFPLLTS